MDNVLHVTFDPSQLEYEDSGSDLCDEIYAGKGGPGATTDRAAAGERLDLSEIFFSNEEYYSKLEELKKAHLRTMAELENMYRRKLQLKAMETLDPTLLETPGHRWAAVVSEFIVFLMCGCLSPWSFIHLSFYTTLLNRQSTMQYF